MRPREPHTDTPRDPLAELARLLPALLDESTLHELAGRLQPLLPTGETSAAGHRLYTAAETAELVSVHVETVRRAIRSGELRVAARIGRSPRISQDAIDMWLTSTTQMTDAGPRRRSRRRQSVLPEHSLRAAFKDP